MHRRWPDQSRPHGLGPPSVAPCGVTIRSRWRHLGNYFVAISHQDGLAVGREAHVFAELVFQDFYTDCTHISKVVPGSYFVKRSCADYNLPMSPHLRIHGINIYVRDQERSLRFYLDQLGFQLAFDVHLQSGQRWVAVTPPDGSANANWNPS